MAFIIPKNSYELENKIMWVGMGIQNCERKLQVWSRKYDRTGLPYFGEKVLLTLEQLEKKQKQLGRLYERTEFRLPKLN